LLDHEGGKKIDGRRKTLLKLEEGEKGGLASGRIPTGRGLPATNPTEGDAYKRGEGRRAEQGH